MAFGGGVQIGHLACQPVQGAAGIGGVGGDALRQGRAVQQAGGRMTVVVDALLPVQGARALHAALHRGDQMPRADRLAQEIIGARLKAAQPETRGNKPGMVGTVLCFSPI